MVNFHVTHADVEFMAKNNIMLFCDAGKTTWYKLQFMLNTCGNEQNSNLVLFDIMEDNILQH